MRTICLAIMMATLALPACQTAAPIEVHVQQDDTVETQIIAVLKRQQAAWNAGNIDAFMTGYWNSPELRFASGGTVTRGFEPTLNRYHERYSNRALMGELSFDGLEVVQLAPDAAVLHGAWHLKREADAPGGLFTLVFRRMEGEWKIISDTTTSAD